MDLKSSVNDLYSFSKLFQEINTQIEDNEILDQIVSKIILMYDFSMSKYIYYDANKNQYFCHGEQVYYKEYEKIFVNEDKNQILELCRKNKQVIMHNFVTNDYLKPILDSASNSLLALPIFYNKEFYGALIFESDDKLSFNSDDLGIFTIFSSQLSFYFRNKTLLDNIESNFLATIKTLISAMEIKDYYTKGHSERVMNYSIQFAYLLGLDEKDIKIVKWAALLHDIGKIGVPESILNKKERLENHEYDILKRHPEFSSKILDNLDFLTKEKEIILHHHERWDGKGYPYGLMSENIPIESRIIALADSYDAMYSDRSYRLALDKKTIVNEFKNNLGKQFDPKLGRKFITYLVENKI